MLVYVSLFLPRHRQISHFQPNTLSRETTVLSCHFYILFTPHPWIQTGKDWLVDTRLGFIYDVIMLWSMICRLLLFVLFCFVFWSQQGDLFSHLINRRNFVAENDCSSLSPCSFYPTYGLKLATICMIFWFIISMFLPSRGCCGCCCRFDYVLFVCLCSFICCFF